MGAPKGNCNAAKNKSACRGKKGVKKRSVSSGAKAFLKPKAISAANREAVLMRNRYGYYNKKTRRFEY